MVEKAKTYEIVSVRDATYLDDSQRVIQGVAVDVRLLDYNERRVINVERDDPMLIKAAIDKLLERRKLIAELS